MLSGWWVPCDVGSLEPQAQPPWGITQPFLLDLAVPGVPTTFRTGYLVILPSWGIPLSPSPSGLLILSTYLSFYVPFPWEGGSVLSGLYAEVGGLVGLGWEWVGGNAVRTDANEDPGTLLHYRSVLGCRWGTWPVQRRGKPRISSLWNKKKFWRNLEKGRLCGWQEWRSSS